MSPTLALPFATQPDLAGTMDIQIPALAWQPTSDGRYRRTYHLDGHPVDVEVSEAAHALHFTYEAPTDGTAERLAGLLAAAFPTMVADLDLGGHPTLTALGERYGGVVVMHAEPFEALVLSVLSQNRTGEIVRAVFPHLNRHCHGISPQTLTATNETTLRHLLRPAGPYKVPRLHETAHRIEAEGITAFRDTVMAPDEASALAYLQTFPGVGHKTAACVLVFSARAQTTLPVDTHLFRVADRLGLTPHDGRLNAGVRDRIITTLCGYGPDTALAHFLFLLLGRSSCTRRAPACSTCPLRSHCRQAAQRQPEPHEEIPAPVGAAR